MRCFEACVTETTTAVIDMNGLVLDQRAAVRLVSLEDVKRGDAQSPIILKSGVSQEQPSEDNAIG
jgi:hypothetical protein